MHRETSTRYEYFFSEMSNLSGSRVCQGLQCVGFCGCEQAMSQKDVISCDSREQRRARRALVRGVSEGDGGMGRADERPPNTLLHFLGLPSNLKNTILDMLIKLSLRAFSRFVVLFGEFRRLEAGEQIDTLELLASENNPWVLNVFYTLRRWCKGRQVELQLQNSLFLFSCAILEDQRRQLKAARLDPGVLDESSDTSRARGIIEQNLLNTCRTLSIELATDRTIHTFWSAYLFNTKQALRKPENNGFDCKFRTQQSLGSRFSPGCYDYFQIEHHNLHWVASQSRWPAWDGQYAQNNRVIFLNNRVIFPRDQSQKQTQKLLATFHGLSVATKLATDLFEFGSARYLHASEIPRDHPDQNIMPLVFVLINSQCAVHFDVCLGGLEIDRCYFHLRGNVWFARCLTMSKGETKNNNLAVAAVEEREKAEQERKNAEAAAKAEQERKDAEAAAVENLEEASGSGGRSDEGGGREGGEEKEEEEEKEEKEEGEERSRGGGGGGRGAGGKTFIE